MAALIANIMQQNNSTTTCLQSLLLHLPALYCAEQRCFSMHAGALGSVFHGFSLTMLVSPELVIQIIHLTRPVWNDEQLWRYFHVS